MSIRYYNSSNKDEILKESTEAKEIVSKIMDYGVSQKQILYIINDLAMNLEKLEDAKRIKNLLEDIINNNTIFVISDNGEDTLEV